MMTGDTDMLHNIAFIIISVALTFEVLDRLRSGKAMQNMFLLVALFSVALMNLTCLF